MVDLKLLGIELPAKAMKAIPGYERNRRWI